MKFPVTEPKLQGCIENHAVKITRVWNRFKFGKIPHYGFEGPGLAVQITIANALHPLMPLLCSPEGRVPVTAVHQPCQNFSQKGNSSRG